MRLSFLTVIVLLVHSTAYSIELKWLNGGRNLAFSETTVCTLLVSDSAPLPQTWRLIWTGYSPDSSLFQFLSTPSTHTAVGICTYIKDALTASHTDTVLHCPVDET